MSLFRRKTISENAPQKTSGQDARSLLIDQLSLSDQDFLDTCYTWLLERPSDPGGKAFWQEQLKKGTPRHQVIKEMVSSDEYCALLNSKALLLNKILQLPVLNELKPEKYQQTKSAQKGNKILAFRADSSQDYDWLEQNILESGYYDRLSEWSSGIDSDKEVIAEMIAHLGPECCLEIGCFTGAVLHLLKAKGIHAEGVEISHLALALCFRDIKSQVHFGDILSLNLPAKYDLLAGMDVFEHLNPNKLDSYLRKCHDLLLPGGRLLTNIPAYGADPVFGEIHPLELEEWKEQLPRGVFSTFPVDKYGWPINGHLIWATSQWWQDRFSDSGFSRDTRAEQELHALYDDKMGSSRRSFFIFRKA